MKKHLLIFAALLSINAHAQITISNFEVTPDSFSFDISGTLPPTIGNSFLNQFDFALCWCEDTVDISLFEEETVAATVVSSTLTQEITSIQAYNFEPDGGIHVNFANDLSEGETLSGTVTATWNTPVRIAYSYEDIEVIWSWDNGGDYLVLTTVSYLLTQTTPSITTTLSGENIQITVPTETGKNYQLQNSSTLTNWTNLGSAISGNGTTNTFTDATDQNAEFYRVEITDNP